MGGNVGSTVTKIGGAAGGAAEVVASTLSVGASEAESKAFMANIQAVQRQANEAALQNAIISNGKALTDALGKNIKGTGDSIKQLGAQ